MREETLKRFFLGEVDADALAVDLDGSMAEGRDTTGHRIEDFEASGDGFEVSPEHLVAVCDAVLGGKIAAEYLQLIGFCVVGSDSFTYDETEGGTRVWRTALEWAAPEANYPLTEENVRKFRERLLTGRDPFAAGRES